MGGGAGIRIWWRPPPGALMPLTAASQTPLSHLCCRSPPSTPHIVWRPREPLKSTSGAALRGLSGVVCVLRSPEATLRSTVSALGSFVKSKRECNRFAELSVLFFFFFFL